jgi:hypothetical protein
MGCCSSLRRSFGSCCAFLLPNPYMIVTLCDVLSALLPIQAPARACRHPAGAAQTTSGHPWRDRLHGAHCAVQPSPATKCVFLAGAVSQHVRGEVFLQSPTQAWDPVRGDTEFDCNWVHNNQYYECTNGQHLFSCPSYCALTFKFTQGYCTRIVCDDSASPGGVRKHYRVVDCMSTLKLGVRLRWQLL